MRRNKALKDAENSDDDEDISGVLNISMRKTGTPGNLSFKETSVAGYSRASGSKIAGMGAS